MSVATLLAVIRGTPAAILLVASNRLQLAADDLAAAEFFVEVMNVIGV